MSKFIRILAICVVTTLAFTNCQTYRQEYSVATTSLNYAQYAQDGFFISEANSVSFDYTPIGSVSSQVSSGYFHSSKIWVIAKPEDGMKEIIKYAQRLGANGLINFKITPFTRTLGSGTVLDGFLLTGMAIKR